MSQLLLSLDPKAAALAARGQSSPGNWSKTVYRLTVILFLFIIILLGIELLNKIDKSSQLNKKYEVEKIEFVNKANKPLAFRNVDRKLLRESADKVLGANSTYNIDKVSSGDNFTGEDHVKYKSATVCEFIPLSRIDFTNKRMQKLTSTNNLSYVNVQGYVGLPKRHGWRSLYLPLEFETLDLTRKETNGTYHRVLILTGPCLYLHIILDEDESGEKQKIIVSPKLPSNGRRYRGPFAGCTISEPLGNVTRRGDQDYYCGREKNLSCSLDGSKWIRPGYKPAKGQSDAVIQFIHLEFGIKSKNITDYQSNSWMFHSSCNNQNY